MKGGLILNLLSALYVLSIFYYTVYGILKSGSEYYCLEGRPDNIDYNSEFSMNVLNLSNSILCDKDCILASNEYAIGIYDKKYKFEVLDPKFPRLLYQIRDVEMKSYEIDYVVNDEFFSLKCRNTGSSRLNISYIKSGEDSVASIITSNITRYRINRFGYLEIMQDHENTTFSGVFFDFNSMSCSLSKAPKTCSLRVKTKNYFFIIFGALMSSALVVIILAQLSVKRYVFRRMFSRVFKFLGVDFHLFDFCNPITSDYVVINKNDIVTHLLESENQPLNDSFLDSMSDSQGEYRITGNILLIRMNGSTTQTTLSDDCKKVIGSYFFNTFVSEKNCAMSTDNTHYLETHNVLNHIISGGGLVQEPAEVGSFGMDVKSFELDYLLRQYELDKVKAAHLLEHNWRFFKGFYEIELIECCLRNRVWSKFKPTNIKWSQWHLYLSDVNRLFEKLGIRKIKGIKTFNATEAYNSTIEELSESINIVQLKSEITINKKKKLLKIGEELTKDMFTDTKLPKISRSKMTASEKRINKNIVENCYAVLQEYEELVDGVDVSGIATEEAPIKEKVKKAIETYAEVLRKTNDVFTRNKSVFEQAVTIYNPDFRKEFTALATKLTGYKNHERAEYVERETKMALEEVKDKLGRPKLNSFVCIVIENNREKFLKPQTKITYYNNILEKLNEMEEKENESKSKGPDSTTVSAKDIMKDCHESKLNVKKIRGRSSKNKKTANMSKKTKTTAKRCYVGPDMSACLDKAVEVINEESTADDSKKPNGSIRWRTVRMLVNLIKKKCFRFNDDEEIGALKLLSKNPKPSQKVLEEHPSALFQFMSNCVIENF